MENIKNKITLRQLLFLFILALRAPSLRIIPNYVARSAGKSSWVSSIVALGMIILLILVLSNLFSKHKDAGLYEVYEKIFGKFLNKILGIVFLVWSLVLACLYLRMYGERFLGTFLFNANLAAVLGIMLGLVYFVINQKREVLGRIAEILTFVIVIAIAVVFVLVFPNIELENIWPVTYYDSVPILKGTVPLVSLGCYITAVMFLGDRVIDKKDFKEKAIGAICFVTLLTFMLILATIGLFGYKINTQFLFPYFITLKSIKILDSIERVESLFISTWLVADFAIVTMFSLIVGTLARKTFGIASKTGFSWVTLITMIIIFFGALYFGDNVYEIELWTRMYAGTVNIILFVGIPVIAWIVGKLRRII